MKKWLVIWLLCITAAGSFIPCCTIDDCPAEEVAGSDHPSKPAGNCSPFFACTACAVSVEITRPLQVPGKLEAPRLVHHEQPALFLLSHYTLTLLQPPRAA